MGLHLDMLFLAMLAYIGPRLKSEYYTINYYCKKVLQFRPQDIRKSLIISYSFLQNWCKMFYSIGFSFVTTFYRFLSGGGKICWLLPSIFPPSNFFKFPPAGIHNGRKESTTSLNWSFWRQNNLFLPRKVLFSCILFCLQNGNFTLGPFFGCRC